MKKNIQQLAAMVAVIDKSIKNKEMHEVISIYTSSRFETTIHITEELFLSTYDEYEKADHTDETNELFVFVEGIKVFALTDIDGVPNA